MGILYSETYEHGRRKKKILGGLIKKTKSDTKKEVFIFGVCIYTTQFENSLQINKHECEQSQTIEENNSLPKDEFDGEETVIVAQNLEQDAQEFWNMSESNKIVQDYSHFRGIGRWNEDFWISSGEKYKERIINAFEEFDVEFLTNLKEKKALEWGIGGGVNARILCELFQSVELIEISKANIVETEKQLKSFNYTNFHSSEINAENFTEVLDYTPSNSIDFLLCAAVFQHMPSHKYVIGVLRIMYKLLADNAYALLQIRYDDESTLYKSKDKDYFENVITFTSFRIDEFKKILSDIGFTNLQITYTPFANYAYFLVQKTCIHKQVSITPILDFICEACPICGSKSEYMRVNKDFENSYISQCSSCSFIFSNVLENQLDGYYAKKYREVRAETITTEYLLKQYRRAVSQYTYLASHLEKLTQKTILEIGSGVGVLSSMFNINGNIVKNYEADKAMYSFACKNTPHFEHVNANYSFNLEKKNSYDIILLSHVFEHLPNPPQRIKEFLQLLKINGVFFIEVPYCTYNSVTREGELSGLSHLSFFNTKTLLSIFPEEFKIIDCSRFGSSIADYEEQLAVGDSFEKNPEGLWIRLVAKRIC